MISVILPTYNENENIRKSIQAVHSVLQGIEHEIIVVDDNSPDRTWETAEKLKSEIPGLKVIRRLHERGLSGAAMTGMAASDGSCIAVMDADLQHDEAILPEMYRLVVSGECDLCIGSRLAPGGSYGEWKGFRKFLSRAATALTNLLLPQPVSDPMSGYFVLSRKLYLESAEKVNPRGFKILLEFTGRNPGIAVREVGYTFRNRMHGETKLSPSVARNFLIGLFDLKFGKYVSSRFAMYAFVGATGVAVNFAGFLIGEALSFPALHTGIFEALDPIYTSALFGIELSIFSNYFLNNYITFFEYRKRGSAHLKGFAAFQLISIFGLVIQTSVFHFFQNNSILELPVSADMSKMIYYAGGIAAATATNYFLNINVTWRR